MANIMEAFSKSPLITACIFFFLFMGVFLQILLGVLYQKMICEADNMATTNNQPLKQCKLKFANCYQLNNGVANIPVFVDKFLNRLTFGPFSFETIFHLSGQSTLISIIFAGIGVCKAIAAGWTMGELLPFYIVSFLGLYLYFSVSSVVDVKGRRRILKVNLVDYLENHLSARMEITENDMEMLYGDRFGGNSGTSRSGSAEREGQRDRRTVELMPFGNYYSAARSGKMSSTAKAGAALEETADLPKDMSGAQASVRQNDLSQQQMEDAQTMAQFSESMRDLRITDEELEALIKEFC